MTPSETKREIYREFHEAELEYFTFGRDDDAKRVNDRYFSATNALHRLLYWEDREERSAGRTFRQENEGRNR